MTKNDGQMHYVGFCRICGTGPLGLRECGHCGEIVVLCDECDAVWTDGDFSQRPTLADKSGALPCPYCGSSLLDAPAKWASKSKIAKVAWLLDSLQQEEVQLESGSPLAKETDEKQ